MESIYRQFALDGCPSAARATAAGINETYLLVTSRPHLYILQKINSYVFHNAAGLMDNIIAVTGALRQQDPDPRHVLTLVPTLDRQALSDRGRGRNLAAVRICNRQPVPGQARKRGRSEAERRGLRHVPESAGGLSRPHADGDHPPFPRYARAL